MSEPKQLKRALGLGTVIVVVISNIIGSGVYKKIAPMAAELHSSGWVLTAWVLAGIITLFGALSNAEVAGLLADTGGEYAYYKIIYNRFFSFLFGWSLFAVIQTASISSLAYLFAQSLQNMTHLPPVGESLAGMNILGVFYPFQDLTIKIVAILLILLFTWINSRGIKTGAGISTVILTLVVMAILVIVAFGLSSPQADVKGIFTLKTAHDTTVTFSAVFTAMLAAFWAYQGWATLGYIGGEIKNAHRTIPLGLTAGVLIIITVYLLVNATYLSLLPVDELERIHLSRNGIAAVEAVKRIWGNGGELFVSLLIALTALGCTHATIMVSCRTYYAMAKEGLFFRRVARLNRAQAPSGALWYQGVWACMLVLSGSFDQLTDMIIFSVFIYYGATALGVFILRRKMPHAPRPYKVWGYPAVPAIVVVFCAALFINTIFVRPREAALGTVLILTGVPLYFLFRRRARRPDISAAGE